MLLWTRIPLGCCLGKLLRGRKQLRATWTWTHVPGYDITSHVTYIDIS